MGDVVIVAAVSRWKMTLGLVSSGDANCFTEFTKHRATNDSYLSIILFLLLLYISTLFVQFLIVK